MRHRCRPQVERKTRCVFNVSMRWALAPALLLLLLGTTACSLAGTWHIVECLPQHASPPFEHITIDARGEYTATSGRAHHVHTETGRYRWNGISLRLTPAGKAERTYSCRRTAAGGLRVSHTQDDVVIVATLERDAE